ncbi:MAG: glycosyltransferase family 2 protein [Rectinemataceae bacterium]
MVDIRPASLREAVIDSASPASIKARARIGSRRSSSHARDETRSTGRLWVWALYAMIACGLVAYAYANLRVISAMVAEARMDAWSRFLLYPFIAWSAFVILLLGFRTVVWFYYRPVGSSNFDDAPSLTVIIPAYNEGAMVLKSIESVLTAHYPPERLEVLVVDDGSRDDTWLYIQRAAERHPGRVTALQFKKNSGKRAALALGFERARGEFVVTLDSDSVIDREALLEITGPFRNPRIGAVAGKVSVYNTDEGHIPRMLHVRFVLTFDVLRAVESSYGTVYCTPGALSAYRISAVRKVLPNWINQRFLGSRCTYGEDRALTNYLLDEGFDTAYQGSAVVYTVVPTTYSKLCRMFLRWDRSYVREEIRFMKIVWKRRPLARLIALCDRLITNLKYPIGYAGLVMLAITIFTIPSVLVRFIFGTFLISVFNSLYYLRSERSLSGFMYSLAFSYFSTFAMWWIMPFAFFTVRSRSWLTR